jgi:hypothetical protein
MWKISLKTVLFDHHATINEQYVSINEHHASKNEYHASKNEHHASINEQHIPQLNVITALMVNFAHTNLFSAGSDNNCCQLRF